MQLIIRTRNLELDERLENYIRHKFGTVEKFVDTCHNREEWIGLKPDCEVFVEVEKETKHHQKGLVFRAEAYMRLMGKVLRADVRAEDAISAVDILKDEFLGEVKRHKPRKTDLERKRSRTAKTINASK